VSAVPRLAATELKLFLREPVTVIFTLALPLMVLYILNGVFGQQNPASDVDAGAPDVVVYRGFDAPDWYTPAYVALAVAGFAFIALPAHMVEYRESGVLRRLHASGLPRSSVLVSQAAVGFVIASLGAGLLLTAALAFAGANPPESPTLFAAAYLVASTTIIGLGLMLGVVLPTARAAQAVGLLAWFVSLFLSRAGPPPEVLPETLRVIGDWLPLTPVVQLLQEPWLTGDWLMRQTVVTAAIGVVSAGIAWRAYRWE
jgi:ABC-2 type transport system permease protein